MGMYHCRKGWGKGVATWGNHFACNILGPKYYCTCVTNLIFAFLQAIYINFSFLVAQDFYKNFGPVWVGDMGSFVFSGEVLLLKDDPDLYLIVCALDCLMKNS